MRPFCRLGHPWVPLPLAAFIFLSLVAVPVFPARAQLVGVSGTPSGDIALIGSVENNGNNERWGQLFTVGASPISVTAATAQIEQLTGAALPRARIYTAATAQNGANLPSMLVQTLLYTGGASMDETPGTANFSYTGPRIDLSAGTQYFFVLDNASPSDYYGWSDTADGTSYGSAGKVEDYPVVTFTGDNWQHLGSGPELDSLLFTLSGSVVPEPSTCALLSTSLLPLGILLLRKRRRSKA